MSKEIEVRELDFLLRFNVDHNYVSPLDFLSNSAWSAIKVYTDRFVFTRCVWMTLCIIAVCLLFVSQVMSFTDEFRGLDRDIEGSPKRWKKLVESECPEKEKFPQEWKSKSSLQKLIMMRALRPDRMTYALRWWVFFSPPNIWDIIFHFVDNFVQTSDTTCTGNVIFKQLKPCVLL